MAGALSFFQLVFMERARETREEIGFSSPRACALCILEISPSYLVLRIRDPFGQRMTKGTPGDEVALPYKKQRLLRRIGLL